MVQNITHRDQKENLVQLQEKNQLQERRGEEDLFRERDDFVIDLVEEDIKVKENQLEDDFVGNQVDHLMQEDEDNIFYSSGLFRCFLLFCFG